MKNGNRTRTISQASGSKTNVQFTQGEYLSAFEEFK